MTNKKKLYSAVAMMLVAAVALTSASYAWFTMNTEVTATGLTMTASVPTNLLIATEDVEASYSDNADLTTTVNPFAPVSGDYETPELFYAVKGIGVEDNTITTFADQEFAEIPGASDSARQYYVDIPIFVKTEELEESTTIDLYIAELTIAHDPESDLANAYKVAVLDAEDGVVGIYANAGTGSWTPLDSATTLAAEAVPPTPQGVVAGTNQVIGVIDEADVPVELTLRVWLEGQDEDCVYATDLGDFALSLRIEGLEVVA